MHGYADCSQVVRVTIPALTLDLLQNEKEFELIQEDVLNELKKFGKILSFIFPTLRDLQKTSTIKQSALGKAFVEFEEVSSAFVCYNLLNEKQFLGHPVVLEFFSRDQYIT
jgi:RNA recognition motif-containing protein